MDFADTVEFFSSSRFEWRDKRRDYGEEQRVAIGFMVRRVCVCLHDP
ncbi:MAG: hypothetical protein C7B43_19570 [Sulfobacillus benefaciens]|uniref:Uncharacterized protein n=1 Tax=Sulfobacillus benefaciens TaxID=453960 RepID=A0A2T2WPR8_9FIRM|nr:MAG: hypothetical protein C7B43_19570 [Sulfobacillus benefaciens]